MAKVAIAYTDSRNRLHATARMATVSDLAHLFGPLEGMATGIAHNILDKRAEIERIYADYDVAVSDAKSGVVQ